MDYSERRPLSIVQSLVLGGSAAAWYLLQTSIALAAKGHRVVVLSPPGGTAKTAAEAGLEVESSIDLSARNPFRLIGAIKDCRAFFESGNFDMVLAHWGADHFGSALALWRIRPGKRPLLVRVRSHDHRPPKATPFTRLLYNRWTDGAVVGADFQLNPLRDRFDYTPERLALVRPGLDPDRFRDTPRGTYRARLGIGDDTLLIGLLARLTPIKGHEVFLRAARRVAAARPEVRFLISGPALQMNLDDIKRQAVLVGPDNRIDYLGPAEDIRRLIADLDIGVVSSLGSETISRIAMEYMVMGKPVVASRVGGLPELIEDGTSGLLVDPGDSDGLAEAIIELIDDTAKRESIGAAGKARIERNYRLSDRVDRLEEFLYSLHGIGVRLDAG